MINNSDYDFDMVVNNIEKEIREKIGDDLVDNIQEEIRMDLYKDDKKVLSFLKKPTEVPKDLYY